MRQKKPCVLHCIDAYLQTHTHTDTHTHTHTCTTHRIHGVLGAIGSLLRVSELKVQISAHMHVHIVLGNSRLGLHIQSAEKEEIKEEMGGEGRDEDEKSTQIAC
jgi:hypothetical protein